MIDKFLDYFIGVFENRKQAFAAPSKFAYIRVTHIMLDNGLIYGQQAYNYNLNSPYRQFVLEPSVVDGTIHLGSYSIKNAREFRQLKGLDKITREVVESKPGCNSILVPTGDTFVGGVDGCQCYVQWRNHNTFLSTQVELGDGYYNVLDQGFSVDIPQKQIWGSKNGQFLFTKI